MGSRSRRVVVLAHCLLNANAKYVGGAKRPGPHVTLLEPYLRGGVGIVQLPCPESSFLGMRRWQMTRDQYDTAAFGRHCRAILGPTVDTLEEFSRAGYEIEGIVGIKGSPSCAVTETSQGFTGGVVDPPQISSRVSGSGVMMTVLSEMLAERELVIAMRDVSDSD